MKKFKKVVTLATATAIAMTSFVGCSSKDDSNSGSNNSSSGTETSSVEINLDGYPIVEEPISIEAFAFGEPGCGDWNDYPIFQEISDTTNVDVTFETVSGDGATEKLNLVLTSNDIPDVFFSGLSSSMINKYASMGLFRPLNDLIENYAPNISALLEERPDIKKAITMPDGNIYAIPAVNSEPGQSTTQIYLNKTWLDKLGLEVPTTTEEFEAVLTAFKTQDPNGNNKADEIPFSYEPNPPYDVWNGDTGFSGPFGVVNLIGNLMVGEDELLYTPIQEGYKEYIEWTSDLYAQGLLDVELFTQDHNMYMAKRSSDYLGGYLTNGPALSDSTEWVCVEPLEGPDGHRLWSQFDYSIDKNRAIISATNEHPEATMRYIDSFFDKEFSIQLRHGKYAEQHDDGKWEIHPTVPGEHSQAPGPYVPTIESKEMVENDLVLTEDRKAALERSDLYRPFLAPAIPNMNLTPEESKELSTLQTDLANYVTEKKAQWTTGQADINAEWDSYIQTLNNMGLERYMEIYNNAYQRYLGN